MKNHDYFVPNYDKGSEKNYCIFMHVITHDMCLLKAAITTFIADSNDKTR